jgi:rhomboid protease GluP
MQSPKRNESSESFALYLARYYMHKRGYASLTVPEIPEIEALRASSDIVLTRSDGITFSVICIIDREANPPKRFECSVPVVQVTAEQCLKYSGTMNGQKMPVTISIFEIGAGIDTAEERERLRAYRRSSIFSKGVIVAWLLDLTAKSAWANSSFRGVLGKRALERLLREPRLSYQDLAPPPPAAVPEFKGPLWATYALLALLAAMFLFEVIYRTGWGNGLFAPDLRTLVAFGGLQGRLVLDENQWFRFLTAPLLHGDLVHLTMNSIALLMVGVLLERMVGSAWLLSVFAIGAIGGSFGSICLNSSQMVSVGASGAIMALFAFALACTFHLPNGPRRTGMQIPLLRVLIPSMLPLAASTGHKVDFGAHLGGALTGAAMGLALLPVWSSDSPNPPGRRTAAAIALLGSAAFAMAFIPIHKTFGKYQLAAQLMPADQSPQTNTERKAKSKELIARYPHDPRSHIYRALALADEKDLPAAEAELRSALNELNLMQSLFEPSLRDMVNSYLATVIALQGRVEEARQLAATNGLVEWRPPQSLDPPRMRPATEINQVLARHRPAFDALFSQYVSTAKYITSGDLTFSFTVAPDGSVTDCRRISSAFNNRKLEGQLAEEIRSLHFSPNDPRDPVSHTYTTTFHE